MKAKRESEMSFWMTLYGKDIDLAKTEELLHVNVFLRFFQEMRSAVIE